QNRRGRVHWLARRQRVQKALVELAAWRNSHLLSSTSAHVHHRRRRLDRDEPPPRKLLRKINQLSAGSCAHTQHARLLRQLRQHGRRQQVQRIAQRRQF